MTERITFKTSVSWRVLSCGSACDVGYWTASHESAKKAVEFADSMTTGRAYEVRDEFMYEGDKIVSHVSEKWRLLK